MLKALASVLLVAYMAMLTTPTLAAAVSSASADVPVCAQLAAHGADISTVDQADCEACELPDCHALHGCAGAAPAVANQVTVQLDLSFGTSDETELSARYLISDFTPTSPPPRA